MTEDEVFNWARSGLIKWLESDGNDVPQHEVAAEADRMLARHLSGQLANAMTCMGLVESQLDERGQTQLYYW